jgi:hypothetical protein
MSPALIIVCWLLGCIALGTLVIMYLEGFFDRKEM